MELQTPPDLVDEVRGHAARSGLTQSDMGDILGISRMAVSRRMNRRKEFSPSELQKLAVAFDITPGELFSSRGR